MKYVAQIGKQEDRFFVRFSSPITLKGRKTNLLQAPTAEILAQELYEVTSNADRKDSFDFKYIRKGQEALTQQQEQEISDRYSSYFKKAA